MWNTLTAGDEGIVCLSSGDEGFEAKISCHHVVRTMGRYVLRGLERLTDMQMSRVLITI